MLELHVEIQRFYELARASPQDDAKRTQALDRVKVAIQALWPLSEIKVFGSFATGLYLPDISDIDIAISGSSSGQGVNDGERLRALGSALRGAGVAQRVEIIGRAKVPIIKFVEARSGIPFDVRFGDSLQELRAAEFMLSTLPTFPCLAPLYLFLKTYLHLKHLNEVYHTGGLASYTLFVMLYTFLQAHPDGRDNLSASGLGILLTGFFHFYGASFNVQEYGISCNSGADFFLKAHRKFLDVRKPYLLAVEDPLMPSNDIGKNSFNFPRIQSAFMESHDLLMSSNLNNRSVSLLKLILPSWAGDSTFL